MTTSATARSYDLLIRGGSVLDGSGSAPTSADVGVVAGRIAAIGSLPDAAAAQVIDATGRLVAPGFIDVHTHTDVLAWLPEHEEIHHASVLQGVTTEVCGNCGFSPFPADPDAGLDRDPYLSALGGGVARAFGSLADYRQAIDEVPMAVNRAPLVGHATLRASVVGYDDRPPTIDELARMEHELERAFDEGALGLSTGLVYPPGQFADSDELIALASVAGRKGRLYTSHLRDEVDHVVEAVEEALRIGRLSGAPVQISHHKVAGKINAGHSERTLSRIEQARSAGVDVAVDLYPYTAASTLLAAMLPPWANRGGPDERARLLADPQARRRMSRDHHDGIDGWQDFARAAGWDQIVLTDHPDLAGMSIAQIGPGRDPYDVLAELLLEIPTLTCVLHMMDERDVAAIDALPWAMTGSDGLPAPGRQHPRVAGSFARVLGQDRSRINQLADRVRRITSLPATRFNLPGRGVVAEGAVADLAVLDPASVMDLATYDDPWRAPAGIDTVIVGGQVAVQTGVPTGVLAGRMLGAGER